MKTSSNFENIHWQLMASLKLVTCLMTTYKLVFLDIIFLAVGLLQLSPFHDNESIVERRIQTSERTVDPNTMTKEKQSKNKILKQHKLRHKSEVPEGVRKEKHRMP
jgi:hypothetical protein